ncbi:MAG: hypothetical protein PHS30_06030, partial [Bacteroidales bacterium]|nr:hypothetical protein [Bacteroidales bacterium]
DYNGEAFDVGDWSIMASGAYNGNGAVPPCMSLLERKLLGWATPIELSGAGFATLPDLGSNNKGFIIKTNNPGEYFLLENRQKTANPWDLYLPHHGMLIYHIDMRENEWISASHFGEGTYSYTYAQLWSNNMVNAIAGHQCADIVEADNERILSSGGGYLSYYTSLKGDPFPGLNNIRSFTDETTPSMKTWSGVNVNKPISFISETNGIVTFDFMGGGNFTTSPESLPARDIKPFQFTASWTPVMYARGYYLDVYTEEESMGVAIKTYVPGYENLLVEDTFSIVNVPDDSTLYYYCVRATNNYSVTSGSNIVSLFTTDSTPVALPATEVGNFRFTANWKAESWAEGYYLDVYTLDTLAGGSVIIKYLDGFENYYTTDHSVTLNELDDQTSYYYRVRSSTGSIDTRNSNVIGLTTPKAQAILTYVKDRTIYLKGMDRTATVRVFTPTGALYHTSHTNTVSVKTPGIYFIETSFNGKRQIIKIFVQ